MFLLYCESEFFIVGGGGKAFLAGGGQKTSTLRSQVAHSLARGIMSIRNKQPISRTDFPKQWMPKMPGRPGVGAGFSTPGYAPQDRSPTGLFDLSRKGAIDSDTHPRIRQLMEPHIKHFGGVFLGEIMIAGNKSMNDFPKLNGQRASLCLSHLLGHCPLIKCSRPHIPTTELPFQFIEQVCGFIRPGIDRMRQEGRMKVPGGPGSKRPKRWGGGGGH